MRKTSSADLSGVHPICPSLREETFAGGPAIGAIVGLLAEDAFHPQLKTHKLKGKLVGSWSCSAGHDLRVVFLYVQNKGQEAILLEAIGTHDEVY